MTGTLSNFVGKEDVDPTTDSVSKAVASANAARAFVLQSGLGEGLLEKVEDDRIQMTADPSVKEYIVQALAPASGDNTTERNTVAPVDNVPPEYIRAVAQEMKRVARIAALTAGPEAMPGSSQSQLTSLAVANSSPQAFVAQHVDTMEPRVAAATHTNAEISTRNSAAMMGVYDYIKGTGLSVIDSAETSEDRMRQLQGELDRHGVDLNLQSLFGSMDQLVLDEHSTVYSPAAYFVDLLEFLRHNNLNPTKTAVNTSVSGQADDLKGFALEYLLPRRPDLQHLELSSENTGTALPYVDIANGVLESFSVNYSQYFFQTEAYRKLASSIYPTDLSYHQPLNSQRTFLGFMKVNRAELAEEFRTGPSPEVRAAYDQKKASKPTVDSLDELHSAASDHQMCIEPNGRSAVAGEYSTHEYWGCAKDEDLQDAHATTRIGLRVILDLLNQSYKMLQTLAGTVQAAPEKRLGLLATFLSSLAPIISTKKVHITEKELRNWALNEFDNVGKLVVLDRPSGQAFDLASCLFAEDQASTATQPGGEMSMGSLDTNGHIISESSKQQVKPRIVGRVEADGTMTDTAFNRIGFIVRNIAFYSGCFNPNNLNNRFPKCQFKILSFDEAKTVMGTVSKGVI
nr:toxin subunit protein [Colletotrichum truncatum]KAF6781333.1 toxin subunit protein [Colletotrichum truncatum]